LNGKKLANWMKPIGDREDLAIPAKINTISFT
jgi:hypothetical protein